MSRTETDVCEECGEAMTYPNGDLINKEHADWCSCHPANEAKPPRRCVWINTLDPNLNHPEYGLIPCIVVEDEAGYSPLIGQGDLAEPWYWGPEATAQRLAADANRRLGLTEDDVRAIVASSIGASIRRQAAQERFAERIWEAGGRQAGQRP